MGGVIGIGNTARRTKRCKAALANPHGNIPLRRSSSIPGILGFGASRLHYRAVCGGRKLHPAVVEIPTFQTCRYHRRPMWDCKCHLACHHSRSTPRQVAGKTARANRLHLPSVQPSLGGCSSLHGHVHCQLPKSPGVFVHTARSVASFRVEDFGGEALRLEAGCRLAVGEILITTKRQQQGKSQTIQLHRNQRTRYDTLVDASSDARRYTLKGLSGSRIASFSSPVRGYFLLLGRRHPKAQHHDRRPATSPYRERLSSSTKQELILVATADMDRLPLHQPAG